MPRPSAPPRYAQVAAEMQARIGSGAYAVGDPLPTEQKLCAEFGVSRHTVREALRRLAMQGLVRRRQGSGTEVTATKPLSTYLHAMHSISELYEYAADTRLDILRSAVETPDAATARWLGRSPGRDWLVVEAVRRERDGAPVSYTRIWITDDFAAIEREIAEIDGPIHELVERRFGARAEEVVQEIAAEPFADKAAEALGETPGAPSVRVTRRYLDNADAPLIVAVSWHPAKRFRHEVRLRREDATP